MNVQAGLKSQEVEQKRTQGQYLILPQLALLTSVIQEPETWGILGTKTCVLHKIGIEKCS